jgi:hypothetical protein
MSAATFKELRAWQLARAFKLGIYELTEYEPLASDFRLRISCATQPHPRRATSVKGSVVSIPPISLVW